MKNFYEPEDERVTSARCYSIELASVATILVPLKYSQCIFLIIVMPWTYSFRMFGKLVLSDVQLSEIPFTTMFSEPA